ncbi:hypothetical protein ANN_05556 [Periplaneta americana]|uniref:Alpha-2-macroglobulin bait region domain-containing protein n=1 Tax=Periplaneta americana TaxID=6978 RepID=A0ABQ8TCY1_PERAM|nr:hypothetical protein ANN_05556 [Periplaneta americana]
MAGLCEGGNEPPGSLKAKEEMILRDMLLQLNDSCEQYGMKLNVSKTKSMVIGRKIKKVNVRVLNEAVEQVNSLILGVPPTITAGKYMLRVEGNIPQTSRGTVFLNETEVAFSPRFLSIVIQTSRPVYKSGQVVHFRVVLLTTDLKPFEDTVNVYVLLLNDGFWKIRVEASEQIEDQSIRVEKYFSPLFEVHVSMPAYTLDTEKYVRANISAHSVLERIARGNATLRMYGKYLKQNHTQKLIWEDKVHMKDGRHDVLVPMENVEGMMGSLKDLELRVEAELTEYLYGETVTGYSHTRIISGSINVYFLGPSPMVFKPGMLFEGHVIVAYNDKERISRKKLTHSSLRIEINAQFEGGSNTQLPEIVALPKGHYLISNEVEDQEWNGNKKYTTEYADVLSVERYRNEGILYFKFEVPPKVSELTLRAFYEDAEGENAQAKMKAVQYYSPRRKYINVRSSTNDAEAGEFAVFHVKTNFLIDSFQYMVLSKGILLYADQQIVRSSGPTITTFALPVARNMAPGFRLLVYHVTLKGELVADSTFVPVNGFNEYNITLTVNLGKDHTKKTAEAIMTANAGSFMAINSMRSSSYFMQAGNEMSKSRMIESFFEFENFTRSEPKVKWRSRQGLYPDEVAYVRSMSHGKNSNETFINAGVIVFTDAILPVKEISNLCDGKPGFKPCFVDGCYPENKKCDGYNDCGDWSDENGCPKEDKNDQYEYKILRRSRSDELYDTAGNDWGWKEMNGEYGGEEFFTMNMPAVSDDWYFMGFCVSKVRGFTAIDTPNAASI